MTQPFDVFNTDFGGRRLRLEDFHDFSDELAERHSAGIVGAIHQMGLHVWRNEFEDFNRSPAELTAKRKRVGMDGGLSGAISGRDGHWQEGQAGGDVDDGCTRLLEQMRQKSRSKADGPEQIGGDDGFGVVKAGLLCEEIFATHDACVIDKDIQTGECGNHAGCETENNRLFFNIELESIHAGVAGDGLIEHGLAPPGDNHLIAKGMEGLCQSAADTGTTPP
jgi:hypothetical protein